MLDDASAPAAVTHGAAATVECPPCGKGSATIANTQAIPTTPTLAGPKVTLGNNISSKPEQKLEGGLGFACEANLPIAMSPPQAMYPGLGMGPTLPAPPAMQTAAGIAPATVNHAATGTGTTKEPVPVPPAKSTYKKGSL